MRIAIGSYCAAIEVLEDRRGRGHRHFVLARPPAEDDPNSQFLHSAIIKGSGSSLLLHASPTHDGAARDEAMLDDRRTAQIETPAFMPVGTQGAVKALTATATWKRSAPSIILGNTYHLMLRPGDELIARRGGLHRFIGWTKPILTDSGGYQVFSLAERRKIDEQRRRVPVASRRQLAPADAGARGRNPGEARLGHRHGARRVPGAAVDAQR